MLCGTLWAGPVHGLWVWKTPAVRADELRDFCRAQNINEVYLSFNGASSNNASRNRNLATLVTLLHRSDIRVEALLSGEGEKAVQQAQTVLEFNQTHPRDRFDGIHLDVEPQQLPENKGAGNLRFLPALIAVYRGVRDLVAPFGIQVNADISNKLLKGDLDQRRMLLSALPRFTLMLYELSSPSDGESIEAKTEKLRNISQKYFDMAYQGLDGRNLAQLSIGLRFPDYRDLLPVMLKSLEPSLGSDPHFLGWAWHSYTAGSRP